MFLFVCSQVLKVGSIVLGEVVSKRPFGIFVKLTELEFGKNRDLSGLDIQVGMMFSWHCGVKPGFLVSEITDVQHCSKVMRGKFNEFLHFLTKNGDFLFLSQISLKVHYSV